MLLTCLRRRGAWSVLLDLLGPAGVQIKIGGVICKLLVFVWADEWSTENRVKKAGLSMQLWGLPMLRTSVEGLLSPFSPPGPCGWGSLSSTSCSFGISLITVLKAELKSTIASSHGYYGVGQAWSDWILCWSVLPAVQPMSGIDGVLDAL